MTHDFKVIREVYILVDEGEVYGRAADPDACIAATLQRWKRGAIGVLIERAAPYRPSETDIEAATAAVAEELRTALAQGRARVVKVSASGADDACIDDALLALDLRPRGME